MSILFNEPPIVLNSSELNKLGFDKIAESKKMTKEELISEFMEKENSKISKGDKDE